MVGVFNQPDFVIADIDLLHSLPKEEMTSGLAEIVKHGCIASLDYFTYLEKNWRAVQNLDHDVLQKIVYDSIAIKAAVVNQDEREQGERRKLNFGHTFGHALEKLLGIPHGAAVSAGMVATAKPSIDKGLLKADALKRIKTLLARFNLPTSIACPADTVFQALKKDKKRQQQNLHFVLLSELGKATVELVELQDLENWLNQGNP
jgi:3-dehydroquinate synthase